MVVIHINSFKSALLVTSYQLHWSYVLESPWSPGLLINACDILLSKYLNALRAPCGVALSCSGQARTSWVRKSRCRHSSTKLWFVSVRFNYTCSGHLQIFTALRSRDTLELNLLQIPLLLHAGGPYNGMTGLTWIYSVDCSTSTGKKKLKPNPTNNRSIPIFQNVFLLWVQHKSLGSIYMATFMSCFEA